MNVVKLSNVTKNYRLGKLPVPALRGVNLEVTQQELLVIKGASGSGKSTTLNIIGAMDSPTTGSVSIGGEELTGLSDNRLSQLRRKRIGFIFQSFNLIPVLNALENVEYPLRLLGKDNSRHLASEMLAQVGLKDFIKHRPNELSGGQIQRVAIARALVTTPDIILADEPTANLDSKTSAQILELILQLKSDRQLTVIMSTHHQYLIDRASRVVECVDGVIH